MSEPAASQPHSLEPFTPASSSSLRKACKADARFFRLGECLVIFEQERTPRRRYPPRTIWIAHPDREPTWAEIQQARSALIPSGCPLYVGYPPQGPEGWRHSVILFEVNLDRRPVG